MLYVFQVALFPFGTFLTLHFFHVALFSCCILFGLHFFHVAPFSVLHSFHMAPFFVIHCSNFFVFYFFRVVWCCTLPMLDYLNVAVSSSCNIFMFYFLFSNCSLSILNLLRGALMSHLFSCCTLFLLFFFLSVLGSFHDAPFFFCISLTVALFSCDIFLILHFF